MHHLRVKDKPCDVLFWHSGQLMGEHVLESDQPHQDLLIGFLIQGIADHVKFNHAPALFHPGCLIPGRMC